jgi:diguanylate cyclase (GGDEF)-like protein
VNQILELRQTLPKEGLLSNLFHEEHEAARMHALESYEILDSAPEKSYDDIARLAAYVCGTPVALVSFFGGARQWVKARFHTALFAEKPIDLPCQGFFDALSAEQGQVLQITDIGLDDRFSDHRLLQGSTKLRFYAAAPLYSPAGELIGNLAVFDKRSRTLAAEQVVALLTLARQIMELLEMRRTLIGLSDANAKLGQQNLTDALTGIPNRRAYDQKLTEEFSRAKRTGTPLSLLLIDIDNFKHYNDTFGHPAGDSALQSVARVLMSSLRPYDFLARYGGEEFVIILPSTDLTDAIVVAERVRGLVASSEFPHRKFTISVGVSRLDVEAGPRALIQAADNGLYRAKAAGRNKVVIGKLNDNSPAGSATP